MKKPKTCALTKAEAKLVVKAVGLLPYSDEGVDLFKKLERFLDE